MNTFIKKTLASIVISLLLSEGLLISITSDDFFTKALAIDTQMAEEFGIDDLSNLGPDPAKEQLYELKDDMDMLTEALVYNKKRLDIDAYDRAELEKYSKLYAALQADPDAKKEYERNGTLSKKLLDDLEITVDPATYDIRVLNSLIQLVKPKEQGGAGRELIKVGSIVKGYTTDRRATSGRQVDPEQKVGDSADYYSSHFKEFGQAVDINEIDYLRGTSFLYEGDELKEKKKLPKIPVEVGWQTNQGSPGTGNAPTILGQNMNKLFSTVMGSLMGQAMQGKLEEKGININLGNGLLQGQTSAQIVQELGMSWLKDNFDLPQGLGSFGYNLGSTGTKVGQAVLTQTLNNVLPQEGIKGNNLNELNTNIGRETVAQAMNLPQNSLYGQNAPEMFTNIGKRAIENDLAMTSGTFDTLDLTNAQKNDVIKKIGQGYTENTLALPQGTFNDLNIDKIKTILGPKYDEIISNTKVVDSLLGVDTGTTESFKEGKFDNFLVIVGNAQVNKTIGFYEAQDNAFNLNISGLTKTNPSKNYFSDYFKNIGYDVTAKALATDEETITVAKTWLQRTNSEVTPPQTGVGTVSVSTINTSLLENKFKLGQNDLTRIFIADKYNNLRSEEVFYRIGQTTFKTALNYSQSDEFHADLESNSGDVFYTTRVAEIKKQVQGLKSATKDQSIIDHINIIETSLNEINDYIIKLQKIAAGQLDDTNALLTNTQEVILEKTNNIQQEILAINKIKHFSQIDIINKNINEMVSGQATPDFSKITEKNLTGFSYNPYSVTLVKTKLINMLKGNDSPDNTIRDIGLAELSDNLDLPEEETLINANKTIMSQGANQGLTILKKAIGTGPLAASTNEINNSLNAAGRKTGLYNIQSDQLANLLLGQVIGALQKIGGKVSNEAFGFLPGNGLKEFNEGSITNFNQVLEGGGLQRIYQFLSLDRVPEQVSTDDNKLSQSYAEEFLGMAKGALTFNSLTVPININDIIAKNGDNGLERTLYALGVNIPSSITVKRDSDRNGYKLDLDNFFNKLKDQNSDFWTNPDNQARIITSVANVGWDVNAVKSIITGKGTPKDYFGLTRDLINKKIGTENPNGSFAFNDYFDLAETLFDGDRRIDGSNKPDLNKILNGLERITNFDLESKIGISSGSLVTILSDPKNAQKELLTQGMRNLSKLFVNDPNINFTTIASSTGQPLQLNVDYNLPISFNLGNISNWDLFGLSYKTGLSTSIPIKLKIPLGGTQDASANFWDNPNGLDSMAKTIANFTKIPKDFGKDIEKFLKGDARNALTAWGVAGATNQYQNWVNDFTSKLPAGSTTGSMGLLYGEVRNAFFDLLPGSNEFSDLLTKTLADKSVNSVQGKVDPVQFNKYFATKFNTFLDNFKGEKLKNLQYAMMDQTIADSLGFQNAPGPGFAKMMLEGSSAEKTTFLKNYVIRMGLGKTGELGQLLTSDDGTMMKCLQGSCPANINWGDWAKNNAALNNMADNQLRQITGWSGMPSGFTQTLISLTAPDGMQNFLNSQNTQYMIGNWLDQSTNMPIGTSYTLWQQYQSYNEATRNLSEAIYAHAMGNGTVQAVTTAQNVLNARTAMGVSLVMNLFFGETFSKLDQQLGLPSGTTSIIMSTIVYAAITGVALGAALMAVMGGPVGIVLFAIGAILGMGKKKESRMEVIYSACGYYPGYKNEQTEIGTLKTAAAASENVDDWVNYQNKMDEFDVVAPDEIESGCPKDFHAENQGAFMQGALPAAQYKVRTLLGNILSLGDLTNDKTMLPTQIQTWNPDDVAFYKDKTAEKFGPAVSPRQGMGYNDTMVDLVSFAY